MSDNTSAVCAGWQGGTVTTLKTIALDECYWESFSPSTIYDTFTLIIRNIEDVFYKIRDSTQ